ncbi:MAG: serine hydrolase [Thermoguttaceae bacterium]|jgi:CubicO group peptidase (beta-lactamase class C family)
MITAVRVVCFTVLLLVFSFRATAEDFTDAIHAFLQHRIEVEKRDVGIVIGIVDEHGSSIVSCGKLDNGTDQEVNGDTLFEIGSITKTFTGLLLEDMVERGEMKLDDPVAKYLPKSVKMPTRNGKEITLLQLATHTSGLPDGPDNLDPKRADNPYTDYTVEKMYAFVSGYKLTSDPGTKYEYSTVGMALLGQAIALKAGTNYESLVVDRICRPLKMDSTRITLTPELKSRFTQGHHYYGYAVSHMDYGALMGGAALRSTANDLLKYISANLGLKPSGLTPLMEKTHVAHFHAYLNADTGLDTDIGLAWMITRDLQGTKIVQHGGLTRGFITFPGFDVTRRRGVVVLSNSQDFDVPAIGMLLLESQWQSDRRPTEAKISSQVYGSYVGQYQLSPDFALGMLTMQRFLLGAPKAAIYIPAAFCLAVLMVLLWRAASFRKRLLILGGAALVSGLLAALITLVLSHNVCALLHPGIGIRREGNRIFAQYTLKIDRRSSPITSKLFPTVTGELFPNITVEFLPESETRFFNRLTGTPVTFFQDARGKTTRLTAHLFGSEFSFGKISDEPPEAPEPLKLCVAIKLDKKLLDACVGQYEFAPDVAYPTGIKLTIWQEGDQLIGQAWGENFMRGAFDIYPESETNYFLKINGDQLTFIKNDKGEVTAVIHHSSQAGVPDCEGKKLKN